MSNPSSAPADAGAQHTAHVGGDVVTLQRPNGAKVSRVFAELRQAGDAVKSVTLAYGDFVRDYEASNVLELDRVQARLEYPPRPIIDPETRQPIREPDELEDGTPNPRAGELVYQASVVDTISDDDWERAGHKLRHPRSPDLPTLIGHLLPVALDLAEDRVYRILALFLMDNREVGRARKDGTIEAVLTERADALLDEAYGDELLELAVVAGELVDHHFRRKAGELGDRMGNAMRLIGMGPKVPSKAPTTTASPAEVPASSSSTPSSSTPTSSTASAANTDGPPTSPSTPPSTSSSPSAPASTSAKPSSSDAAKKSA